MKKIYIYVLNYDWPEIHEIEVSIDAQHTNDDLDDIVSQTFDKLGLRVSNCEYLTSGEQLPLIKRTLTYDKE